MKLWPRRHPKPTELQRLASIGSPDERLRAYSGAVVKHLEYPKNGSTPWAKDATHIRQAVHLLEQMARHDDLPSGPRADALEAVRDLSHAPTSPLRLAERKDNPEKMFEGLYAVIPKVKSWADDGSIEERIAALRASAQREEALLDELSIPSRGSIG